MSAKVHLPIVTARRMTGCISRGALFAGAYFALPLAAPAMAQTSQPPVDDPSTASVLGDGADRNGDEEAEEIIVTGQRPRGSVIGDIPPENTLNARDVRATGATDVTELLEALAPQIGSARGREGGRPITLLNGQRISSFRELRDLPTEAIQRVEILPEEVALKYGYRADQRVVNIILRERFQSTAVRAEARTATEGDYLGGLTDGTRLMIGRDSRTTINLRAEGNDALRESDRDIAVDPGAEGEIDERDARTLLGSRSLVRGTVTHNRTVFGNVSATLNGELEHVESRSLLGLPRFEDELPVAGSFDARVRNTSSDSAHAGIVLNGDQGRWRWSATGNGDLARNLTRSDPDDIVYGRDRSRSTRTSGDLTGTANGPLFTLPAGDANATVRLGASALRIDSSRRSEDETSATALGRRQGNASVNFDLPVSRRNRDFDALGNLTLNANAEVEQLSDFGTLSSIGAGANWSPVEGLNVITSWTREEGAPSIQQLGEPVLDTPGTRIFDFTRGETVLVNAITGGNRDLDSDRRNVWKIGGNWQPFSETDFRLRGEYVRSRLDGPISNFPGTSAALEAAFPERFARDAPLPGETLGQLISADLRPVNFDSARRDIFRWGFDFTKPLRSARPSQAVIDQLRARRGAP
ncbi:MAG: TonB-dependent receptor, partial [Sphingomonas sp.]|nr:TonB-dependent receptor [Sphingomonas sp.]